MAGFRGGHDTHSAIILVLQRGERHDVGRGFGRLVLGAIAGGKGPAVAARQSRRPGRRRQLGQRGLQIFLPAAHQLAQPAIERGGLISGEARSVGYVHHIVHARQALLAQFHLVTRDAALQFLRQHLSGGFAQAAGVEITRHINERGDKATERIGAGEQLRPRPVEQGEQPQRHRLQLIGAGLEQFHARKAFQHMHQRLGAVATLAKAQRVDDLAHLTAQQRHLARRGGECG